MKSNNVLTTEEQRRLDWCLCVLEEEQISECQAEAEGIAFKEAHAAEAYDELLPLLVKLKVREFEDSSERLRPKT